MKASRMKLGTTLGIAFAALVLMTLCVVGVALNRLGAVNAAADELATSWLPSIKLLGEIRNTSNRIRRMENDHLLSVSDTDRDKIEKQMEEQKALLTKELTDYAPLISSPEERTAFEEFKRQHDVWLGLQTKLLQLSHGGAKTAEQARSLLRGDSRQAFDGMAKAIGTTVEINNKGSVESAATAKAAHVSARWWMTAIGVAALVLAAVLALLIVRSVTRLLGGEPAEAAAIAQRVADGDLSATIELRKGDSQSLLAALKRMQDSLSAIVTGVRNNADGVAIASSQIAQGNNDLSSRTEEQASALQQTAASMKELAVTVRQNAADAQQGNQLALEASTVATRGGEVVHQVVETMKGINESSRKIADIIGVIDGIAFQTNILALNAAVEAARAGEQGRGFAVVAGEVRTLAQRSADAAKEIKDLITASVGQVEQGSSLVDQAGTTMEEVVRSIRRVTDLMGSISAASDQQSTGVAQIGEAVNQMDQATQQNAALVEESAAAADSLRAQAGQLVGAVAVFKVAGGAQPAANMDVVSPVRPVTPVRAAPAKISRTQQPAPERLEAPAPAKTGTTDEWTQF